jgi:hypothetical protein
LFAIASRADAILSSRWRSVEHVAFELATRRRLSYLEFLKILSRW